MYWAGRCFADVNYKVTRIPADGETHAVAKLSIDCGFCVLPKLSLELERVATLDAANAAITKANDYLLKNCPKIELAMMPKYPSGQFPQSFWPVTNPSRSE